MTRIPVAAVMAAWLCAAAARGQEPLRTLAAPAFRIDETVPVISWKDAQAFMDREVFVVGRIVSGKRTRTMCFLDFERNSRQAMVIVIRSEDLSRFDPSPEKACLKKNVKVHGWVSEYRGQPQMFVSRPESIVILPDDAPLPKTATTPTASRPAPRDAGTVTIATYNVENLYDAWDDPYTGDENTPVKSRGGLEKLSATIHKIDADVLALAEVENRGILEQFNRVLLADLGYTEVVLFEGNDVRGIDVALLSRLPVGPVTSHRHMRLRTDRGDETSFRRDLLRVRIEPPGAPPFEVFVVHMKHKESDADDASLQIRLAEARAIRAVLDATLAKEPEARFVVCGDFNDLVDSPPLKTILGSGPTALRSFHDEIAEERRITYSKEPYRSMIDYVLCSPSMARHCVPKSYHILDGTQETSGSDHNPVVLRFGIR